MNFGRKYSNRFSASIYDVPYRHKLSTKLFLSIFIWVFCAILFTGYTLILLWFLETGEISINNAGSLRMKVFHITTLLSMKDKDSTLEKEMENFSNTINQLKKPALNIFPTTKNNPVQKQTASIESSWQNEIMPLVKKLALSKQSVLPKDYYTFKDFVNRINQLVKNIEKENTRHITWLRIIQSILIIMVLISTITAIYILYKLIINPLTTLQNAIQNLSNGNFSERITPASQDEFGAISLGFNHMAHNLEDLYNNLEQKVHAKTISLKNKNEELSILYTATKILHESNSQEVMIKKFIEYIMAITQSDMVNIRIFYKGETQNIYVLNETIKNKINNVDLDLLPREMRHPNTTDFFIVSFVDNTDLHLPIEKSLYKTLYHIQHSNISGTLSFYSNNDNTFHKNQSIYFKNFIETLAKQLAISIENQHLMQNEKQLAILHERNLIAQNLHDSIAQSLSFLNIQTQLLKKAIIENNAIKINTTLNFIQQGVQESYEDVRELLINFRTRINEKDFNELIDSLLDQFKRQNLIKVTLDIPDEKIVLEPEQQLQVIFILQEALSNIRKHANCSKVNITIKDNNPFFMVIEDNGCGFKVSNTQKNNAHVGLSIMKERALQINGHIEIVSIPQKGTSIYLTLPKKIKDNV